MLYIALIKDKPDVQAKREALMAEHVAWIQRNRSWLLLAGSMRSDRGATPQGGLWIMDVGSKLEAEEKIKEDPFWKNGLRASADVCYWGMAYPDMEITSAIFKRSAES